MFSLSECLSAVSNTTISHTKPTYISAKVRISSENELHESLLPEKKEQLEVEKIKEKQARQSFPKITSSANGNLEMKWVPPLPWIPGKCRLKFCDYALSQIYCCRRKNGLYWNLNSDDDTKYNEALELAKDATNYCPDCLRRETGRIKVCAGDYFAENERKKNALLAGVPHNPPQRKQIPLHSEKPKKSNGQRVKESSISKSSKSSKSLGKKSSTHLTKSSIRFTYDGNNTLDSTSHITSEKDDFLPGGIDKAFADMEAMYALDNEKSGNNSIIKVTAERDTPMNVERNEQSGNKVDTTPDVIPWECVQSYGLNPTDTNLNDLMDDDAVDVSRYFDL